MAGNRIERLAALARTLTVLPVAKQFEILANEGLRLEDIGWKVPSSDTAGLVTRIPTTQDGKSPEAAQ